MKLIVVNDLGATPARVHRPTGTIYWSRKFNHLPLAQKVFILMHELGHYNLQTTNEFAADEYAFNRVAGKFPESLRNSIHAMNDVFNYTNPQQKQRVIENLKRAFEFDWKKNNNKKALYYLNILNGNKTMNIDNLTENEAQEIVQDLKNRSSILRGVKNLVNDYLPENNINIEQEYDNYSTEDELEFSNYQTEKAVLIQDLRDPENFKILVADYANYSGFDESDIYSQFSNYLDYLENEGVMDSPFSDFSFKKFASKAKYLIPGVGQVMLAKDLYKGMNGHAQEKLKNIGKVALPIAAGVGLTAITGGIGAGAGAGLIGNSIKGLASKIIERKAGENGADGETKIGILQKLGNVVSNIKGLRKQLPPPVTGAINPNQAQTDLQQTQIAQTVQTAQTENNTQAEDTTKGKIAGDGGTGNGGNLGTETKKSKKWLFIILGIVAVAVIGFIIYKSSKKE